jgi:hypothetical protein
VDSASAPSLSSHQSVSHTQPLDDLAKGKGLFAVCARDVQPEKSVFVANLQAFMASPLAFLSQVMHLQNEDILIPWLN